MYSVCCVSGGGEGEGGREGEREGRREGRKEGGRGGRVVLRAISYSSKY